MLVKLVTMEGLCSWNPQDDAPLTLTKKDAGKTPSTTQTPAMAFFSSFGARSKPNTSKRDEVRPFFYPPGTASAIRVLRACRIALHLLIA